MRHYDVDEGLTHIFQITDTSATEVANGEPIKLLEVSLDTPETGIMPLHFGPSPASGIPYAPISIEVSPSEFERIQSNG
jgi:hypothetical protein